MERVRIKRGEEPTERVMRGNAVGQRQKRRQPRLLGTAITLDIGEAFYLVADAYYACQQVALHLQRSGSHLVSRVRRSTAAYEPVPVDIGPRTRGRPRLYGQKIKLWTLFESRTQAWQYADSHVYGERDLTIRFLCLDLLWRPLRSLVRFVLVDHPTRGRLIFLCTDLTMPAIVIIRLYGLRFKIELSFKQALRVLGVYAFSELPAPSLPSQFNIKSGSSLRSAAYGWHCLVARSTTATHLYVAAASALTRPRRRQITLSRRSASIAASLRPSSPP